MKWSWILGLAGVGLAVVLTAVDATANELLSKALTFHASFDETSDADFARGNAKIHTLDEFGGKNVTAGITVEQVARDKDGGRWGGCLRFSDVSKQIIMFQGEENIPYDAKGFDTTISFWMSLSPDEDLKPGYVDPVQITDKKWNDASVFIDFTKDNPRVARLGCFSDFKFWNPSGTDWEAIADADRPLVSVSKPPFDREAWTHVVIVLQQINATSPPSMARLYLDGRLQGQHVGPHRITWDPENLRIMLGIQYIGGIDDFAVFDAALTPEQIRSLAKLKNGVADLR